jgi:WXG100 family type VII secretion target
VPEVSVAPDQLAALAARLRAGAAEVEELRAQLGAACAPLVAAWAGPAQAEFDARLSAWQRDAAALEEGLVELAALAARAADAYAATEQAVTGTFRPR